MKLFLASSYRYDSGGQINHFITKKIVSREAVFGDGGFFGGFDRGLTSIYVVQY